MGQKPESRGTVVELKSDAAIVRAASYVEDELVANLELETLDPHAASVLDRIIALVRRVGFGQGKHLLLESCDQLIETLEALPISQLAPLPRTPEPLGESVESSAVEAELARRAEMRERVGGIQETLQNKRDTLREELGVQAELIRLKLGNAKTLAHKRALEKEILKVTRTIDAITSALSENDRDVQTLIMYREACKFAARGLPPNIIGRNFNLLTK